MDLEDFLCSENSFLKKVYVFDSVTSTNDVAKEIAETSEELTLVISRCQTMGRGRHGRVWVSEKDEGLYLSLIQKPKAEINVAPLTLVTGYAVCETLRKLYNIDALIKWPNDIVVNDKKICGVLLESAFVGQNLKYVVTGVGINTFIKNFAVEELISATSLENLISAFDTQILISEVVKNIYEKYMLFCIKGFPLFKNNYEKLLVNLNKNVVANFNGKKVFGVAQGISEDGALEVIETNGTLKKLTFGEVSVRGQNGYV